LYIVCLSEIYSQIITSAPVSAPTSDDDEVVRKREEFFRKQQGGGAAAKAKPAKGGKVKWVLCCFFCLKFKILNGTCRTDDKNSKKGKQARVWDMSGRAEDAATLDFSSPQPPTNGDAPNTELINDKFVESQVINSVMCYQCACF
jgi:hypothetical protein